MKIHGTKSEKGTGCFVLILMMACCFTSCYTARVYAPPGQNIPGFNKKGDLRLSAHIAVNNNSSVGGRSLQAAYAPLNNFGATISYTNVEDFRDQFKSFELGAGYFNALEPSIIVETYAGFGLGKATGGRVVDYNTSITGDIRNKRVFIQPSITFKSKVIEFALGLKMSRVNFYNLNLDISSFPEETQYQSDVENAKKQIANIKAIEKHSAYSLIEPSFTLRAGIRNIKAQLQVAFAPSNDNLLEQHMHSMYTSLGFVVALPVTKKPPKGE